MDFNIFNIMETWIILLAILVGTISVFVWHKMTFFKNIGIPYASPVPIFGNMASVIFQTKHIVHVVQDLYFRWPDAKYFGFYDFTSPVIVIRDPELIKSVAVKHFDNFPDHRNFVDEELDPLFGKSLFGLKGAKWREVRQLLSPAFTASKMKAMSELMSKCAIDFSDYLINDAVQNVPDIEIKNAFTRYTNDVIASCAFGISVDSMRNPNNDFYVLGKNATNFDSIATLKMFITRMCPRIARLLNLQVFDSKMTNFFKNIIETTIETRDKEGIVRPDMLQLMMEARGKTSSALELTITDMMAQAFLFFFGGFDTSSALMSFTAMALAQNPEIQKKLQDEIDHVMKETNGNPTYDSINAMPYLEALLYETLRYYPIAGFLDRMCVTSFELPPALPGLKPFTVTPGMNIWFPASGIHSDPEYYPDPDVYDPERFMDKKMTANQPTFLAFGIGPRSCIGNRFALLENKLVLFYILAKCNFRLSHKTKLPLTLSKKSFTVMLEGGFWIKLELRDKTAVFSK